MSPSINLRLYDLQPANLAYLTALAKAKNISADEMAIQLLDRHIRAVRYFDPNVLCNPVAETRAL